MKRLIILICLASTIILSPPVLADSAQMNETLAKIVNQLAVIKQLVVQAQQQQDANPRVKVHFTNWEDTAGKTHRGLSDDIDRMQQALIDAINHADTGPRTYPAISNDYIHG